MTQVSPPTSLPLRRRPRRPRPPLELTSIQAKLTRLLADLDRSLIERTTHVRVALLALLAGHHVLLIGPPGTAKSQLARALCLCVREARFFEYLLSKFTHPDELFGPVSIPGLKEEDYRRLTDGYLPRANIAFLDEIFKANSSILNSLLTLINERVFHHGKRRDPVPLLGLIGASNELPETGGGLEALYDRFLLRIAVPPIAADEHFLKVSLGELPRFQPPEDTRLTVPELRRLRELAGEVTVEAPVRQALLQVRAKLRESGVEASDRRWRWAIDLLRMSALTANRRSLSLLDLTILEYCFGDPTDAEGAVRKCVREGLTSSSTGADLVRELKQAWVEQQGKPVTVAFDRWRQELLARVDEFTAQCDRACAELDDRLKRLEDEQKQTPWLVEVPPELAAGLMAARLQFQTWKTFVAQARGTITQYSPAKLVFEKLSEGNRSWGYHHVALCVHLPGTAPNGWLGLHGNGAITSVQAREETPRLELDDATAHALIFHPDLTTLAQKIAEAAVKPIVVQLTIPLQQQARRSQALIEGVVEAITAVFGQLRQNGTRPPHLPALPEPASAKEAQRAKLRA